MQNNFNNKNNNNNYLYYSDNNYLNNNYAYENRGKPNNKKKKDFKTLKNNTIHSLNDVEYFLNNLSCFSKGIKLYKILKK